MPRWRRRRLNRLHKKNDDHVWVLQPLRSKSKSEFSVPSDGVRPQADILIKINWQMSDFKFNFGPALGPNAGSDEPTSKERHGGYTKKHMNFRKCTVCGQESINGLLPKMSCREYIARRVMDP
jgi:hypothetical protein